MSNDRTAPYNLREILVQAALNLMQVHTHVKTLRDALDIVQEQLGIPEQTRQP